MRVVVCVLVAVVAIALPQPTVAANPEPAARTSC